MVTSSQRFTNRDSWSKFLFFGQSFKRGFSNVSIGRLSEVLPPQHQKKEIEKNFLSEWKKLVGMNEVHARFRYVQLCRSLKTYGMTVFQVKVGEVDCPLGQTLPIPLQFS